MDPYIQRNMTNYLLELNRLFPTAENKVPDAHSVGTAECRPGQQSPGSAKAVSPEGPFPHYRRPDTPFWPTPMELDGSTYVTFWNLRESQEAQRDFPAQPTCTYLPPARAITKSNSSTDSASPDSTDLSIIRRPDTPFSATWKPKPFGRKITKTYDNPLQTPPAQYVTSSSFSQTPITPKRFQKTPVLSSTQTSPDFAQYSTSPENFYTQTRRPMSPQVNLSYPTFCQTPVSSSTDWSPNASGGDGSYYSLTPQSGVSWHDSSVLSLYDPPTPQGMPHTPDQPTPQVRYNELFQGLNDSLSATPKKIHGPNFVSTPKARFEPLIEEPQTDFRDCITDPIRPELKVPFELNSSKKRNGRKCCPFCRKNGESPQVYYSHHLRVKKSKKVTIITCPILRSLVCSTCGASGDNAHTSTYCPVVVSHNNGKRQPSATVAVKSTRIKSNGQLRY